MHKMWFWKKKKNIHLREEKNPDQLEEGSSLN